MAGLVPDLDRPVTGQILLPIGHVGGDEGLGPGDDVEVPKVGVDGLKPGRVELGQRRPNLPVGLDQLGVVGFPVVAPVGDQNIVVELG